jgi:hypothetical protein
MEQMNTFLLVDDYEDCTIGIITTKMSYEEFEKEIYEAKKKVWEDEDDDYDDYYLKVFDNMWEKDLKFEVSYINRKIYI